MSKDYYSILGVEKGASQDDIKSAYKKLAKKYHPDINKEAGATEKFKEINEAASVLGDAEKRKHYDQFGTAGHQNGGFDPRDFAGFNFDDVFDNLFSGFGFKTSRNSRGHDLQAEIVITLQEVAKGTTKELAFKRHVSCKDCDGQGGDDLVTCQTCNGQGAVRQARKTPFGVFATTSNCHTCKGTGQVPENVCTTCNGDGRVISREPINVKVPAGIHDGTRLRVAGEGEAAGQGGTTGDLYVYVHVEQDERFERDGDNLIVHQPVHFVTACLGGKIEIDTLDGKKTIEIKAGTQNNEEITIEGYGLPELHERHHGDLIVKVGIDIPKKLTKKQQELLKDFDKDSKKKFGLF